MNLVQAHQHELPLEQHPLLERRLAAMEAALDELDAKGGKVTEDAGSGRVRVYPVPPLRSTWNTYVAEVKDHLRREQQQLPLLIDGLTGGHADEEAVYHGLTALVNEHELLLLRSAEARKVFMGVRPLRSVFARVEEAIEDHALQQDIGIFRELFERLNVDGSDTPTLKRSRIPDPIGHLRQNLSYSPPPPAEPPKPNPVLHWLKRRLFRLPKVKY